MFKGQKFRFFGLLHASSLNGGNLPTLQERFQQIFKSPTPTQLSIDC
ncbi:hypothetical protein FDUTEX481_08440 [Tolypothrix sp. PCC 7601]|nr:hypothetical protein FDUTEX481_08440 [Tolypothrix sp. PCC 7601]